MYSTPEKTAILIQARSGSSRLPQKCFLPLPAPDGRTLIEWVFSQMMRTQLPVFFLVPTNDYGLQSYLAERHIPFLIGSEDDVRDRYRQAAAELDLDIIIRATGDNPFLDPEHVLLSLRRMAELKCDLFSFTDLPLGIGVELFRRRALDECVEPVYPIHREHVSLHIKHNPDRFTVVHEPSPFMQEWRLRSGYSGNLPRLTIDEPADYQTLSIVARRLQPEFTLVDLLDLFLVEPDWFAGNRDVEQRRF